MIAFVGQKIRQNPPGRDNKCGASAYFCGHRKKSPKRGGKQEIQVNDLMSPGTNAAVTNSRYATSRGIRNALNPWNECRGPYTKHMFTV
jgi:hypothetical protein